MKVRTITIALLLVMALGTMAVMPATAQTATRDLPDDCVPAGQDFTVTVLAENYGVTGAVIETLCDGWVYKSSTGADDVQTSGNTVSFLLMGSGPRTITYTVTAPNSPGACCPISGDLIDENTTSYTVGGETDVCVCNGGTEPSATRDLPDDCVTAGLDFTVTVLAENYGVTGAVIETLCDGWVYKSSTGADDVQTSGNTVSFLLMGSGPRTITYTVTAPNSPGACCPISGDLIDENTTSYTVGGETDVCVCNGGTEPSATRDLPDDCVTAGLDFTVTVLAENYGVTGAVIETLCDGWVYKSSTGADDVQTSGNTVSFLLMGSGPRTITYTVTAPNSPGACCPISGDLIDENTTSYTVGGETDVCVCNGDNGPSATRDLPDDCVPAGQDFTVTVLAENYGFSGAVIETLCDGWVYQSSTGADDVVTSGNTVSFLLMGPGPKTITYTVTAPNDPEVCCPISGELIDENTTRYTVGGETDVCTCSENDPPLVTLIFPTGGEALSGEVTLNASAVADPDGSIVSVVFYCSDDSGSTWDEIGAGASASDYYTCTWDTREVENGDNYKVKAVAEDNLAGTGAGEDESGVFTIDNGFCLHLNAGWNLVSVPKTIDGTNDAQTVFDINPATETCEYYDACADDWLALGDIDVIQCRGYWVYKVDPVIICVDLETGTGLPPSQELCEGWNMIGHIDTSVMPIYEEGNNADFGSWTGLEGNFAQVWQWTQGSGWECGYPSGLNYMTPGQGYWIWMNVNDTMAGMP